jgi:dTDP-glucose 4,6-dehydratase
VAGFIGSNFVLDWLAQSDELVINLDTLTYAGNLNSLASVQNEPRHIFVRGAICDRALVDDPLATHKPRAIVNFAAEKSRRPFDSRSGRLRHDQCQRNL